MQKWEGSEGKAATEVVGKHWEEGNETVTWLCRCDSKEVGWGASHDVGMRTLGKVWETVIIYGNCGEKVLLHLVILYFPFTIFYYITHLWVY